MFHDSSKHIDIRYHFIKYCVQCGAVQLQHVSTEEQVVDILTKALGRAEFLYFREQMGIVETLFSNRDKSFISGCSCCNSNNLRSVAVQSTVGNSTCFTVQCQRQHRCRVGSTQSGG